MGVVHKLQDDVRDFIIAQKKSFLKISCRKLSDIVYDKFSIVVSKSSISSVLKSANLNSPIGRHSLSVDELAAVNKQVIKKFKIPQQKKTQLFGNKIEDALVLPDENVNLKVRKNQSPASLIAKNEGGIVSSQETMKSSDQGISNLGDNKLTPNAEQSKKSQGVLVQNAGSVFLKAVEWNLTGVSILGKVLKDELSSQFDIDFNRLADLVILSKKLDVNDINKFENEWRKEPNSFLGLNDRDDVYLYQSALAAAENISDCGMKLLLELEVFLHEVFYYKITYGNGQNFYINANSRNVHCENVQSGGSISMRNALKIIDLEYIRNVHSSICCYSAINTSTEKIIESFFAIFKNQSQSSVSEITLFDENNVELVKYNNFYAKHKTGVLVVWSWEKTLPGMTDFLKTNQEIKSLEILNETYFSKQCSADKVFSHWAGILENFSHVIAISRCPTESPFVVLLTNVGADQEAARRVVYDFLLIWLGSEKRGSFSLGNNKNKSMVALAKKSLEQMQMGQAGLLFESIKVYRYILRSVSQQYFFDLLGSEGSENRIVEQIYGLSGLLSKDDRICRLFFDISEQDAAFLPLKRAIQRFNEVGVFDTAGSRIILQAGSALDS